MLGIGAALYAAGSVGSILSTRKAGKKAYKSAMASMNQAESLINQQYGNVEQYFKEAGGALETQYGSYYSQQMQDAINALAGTGIYESPVSERALSRTRQALGETYAAAKSELAGQKLSAISAIDQQKIGYLQNLASLQYNKQLAKQEQQAKVFSAIGGAGMGLLGVK